MPTIKESDIFFTDHSPTSPGVLSITHHFEESELNQVFKFKVYYLVKGTSAFEKPEWIILKEYSIESKELIVLKKESINIPIQMKPHQRVKFKIFQTLDIFLTDSRFFSIV